MCTWLVFFLCRSSHLPADIEPEKAADAFREQRDSLSNLLRSDLPNIANKLYSKSIISPTALAEALNETRVAIARTVSLLSVVEDRIRVEPHVFTEFVKVLESEPSLLSQASALVMRYRHGMLISRVNMQERPHNSDG